MTFKKRVDLDWLPGKLVCASQARRNIVFFNGSNKQNAESELVGMTFIASEELQYGTRCTTAMTITHSGEIAVVEKSYPSGSLVEFEFSREP